MMPAASDSPADAPVWTWLASSTVLLFENIRNSNIAMTAAGIDAETVMPTFKPT